MYLSDYFQGIFFLSHVLITDDLLEAAYDDG